MENTKFSERFPHRHNDVSHRSFEKHGVKIFEIFWRFVSERERERERERRTLKNEDFRCSLPNHDRFRVMCEIVER